ncbi:MAG: hypothetical protein QXJ16_03765 [Desulfurococcaceae archaeon]
MSIATGTGVLGRFLSIFRAKDPLKREIVYSINTIDKILRSLEVTKKSLEAVAEEHKKRIKASDGDKEFTKILEEETRNIHGYLNLMTKSIYDLMRVKYRLETLFYVEEPLKVLPEVLEELRSVEPVIEKINPQLLSQIRTLEQKVAGLLAMSSMNTPALYSALPSTSAHDQQVQKQHQVSPVPEKSAQINNKTTVQLIQEYESLQPPSKPLTKQSIMQSAPTAPIIKQEVNVPLNVVEQWILLELKQTAGILDLSAFEKKYGVPRALVLEALRSLESKNVVKVRRK